MPVETSPRIREIQSLVSPCGVRFWDLVEQRIVSTGLQVEFESETTPGKRFPATANGSGTYVPWGLRRLFEDATGSAVPASGTFTLFVHDPKNQYVPCRLSGLKLQPGSWVEIARDGVSVNVPFPAQTIPLFPSIGRVRPGWGAIRAELWDTTVQRPAAGALVRAIPASAGAVWGLSDSDGRVHLLVPWPAPIHPPIGSPPPPQASWPVLVEVWYGGGATESGEADLTAVLRQPLSTLQTGDPTPAKSLTERLSAGAELTLRSPADDGTGSSTRLQLFPGSP